MPGLRVTPTIVIAGSVALLAAFGVIFVVMEALNPAPGPEVASTRVTSGQPFSVTWVSDGQPKRAWLDARCAYMGFPFLGSARVSAGGATLVTEPLEVERRGGSSTSSGTVDGITELVSRILFEVPATPTGTGMRIDGVMTLQPQTTIVSTAAPWRQEIPPAHELRFYVAP